MRKPFDVAAAIHAERVNPFAVSAATVANNEVAAFERRLHAVPIYRKGCKIFAVPLEFVWNGDITGRNILVRKRLPSAGGQTLLQNRNNKSVPYIFF